jgi:hypothetical protein
MGIYSELLQNISGSEQGEEVADVYEATGTLTDP